MYIIILEPGRMHLHSGKAKPNTGRAQRRMPTEEAVQGCEEELAFELHVSDGWNNEKAMKGSRK